MGLQVWRHFPGVLLSLLIILHLFSPTFAHSRVIDYDSAEATQVYSALLTDRYFAYRPRGSAYLIEAEAADAFSHPYAFKKGLKECFPKLAELQVSDWQAVLDLQKQGSIPRMLPKWLEIKIPYELVERKQLEREVNDHGVLWAGFEKRHPESNGITSLSSVGFNESKDRALVFVSFVCGILCGGAQYYTLEKRGGHWQIVEPAASCSIMY